MDLSFVVPDVASVLADRIDNSDKFMPSPMRYNRWVKVLRLTATHLGSLPSWRVSSGRRIHLDDCSPPSLTSSVCMRAIGSSLDSGLSKSRLLPPRLLPPSQ